MLFRLLRFLRSAPAVLVATAAVALAPVAAPALTPAPPPR